MIKIGFYIKETFKSVFRNRNTSIATILSMTLTLLILGITLLIILNLDKFVLSARQEFSGIQIFLKNEVDKTKMDEFEDKLRDNQLLKDIIFVSKDETMESFKNNIGYETDIFSDIENPCENSFIVYPNDAKDSADIVEELKKDTRVSSISFYQDTIEQLVKISNIAGLISIIVIVVLFVLSLLIIENMIKITIFSRMREINIMKVIGATNWFIRWPFILEGALLGFIGSFSAFLITDFAYAKVYSILSGTIFFSKYIVDKATMSSLLLSLFVLTGIGIGILGSVSSLRKYLKV